MFFSLCCSTHHIHIYIIFFRWLFSFSFSSSSSADRMWLVNERRARETAKEMDSNRTRKGWKKRSSAKWDERKKTTQRAYIVRCVCIYGSKTLSSYNLCTSPQIYAVFFPLLIYCYNASERVLRCLVRCMHIAALLVLLFFFVLFIMKHYALTNSNALMYWPMAIFQIYSKMSKREKNAKHQGIETWRLEKPNDWFSPWVHLK